MDIINKIVKQLKISLSYIFINKIATSALTLFRIRHAIYKIFGMNILGYVYPRCYFENNNIKLGSGSFINENCSFYGKEKIEIGNNCSIAQEVMFCTTTHKIGIERRANAVLELPIKIEDRCWVGARSIILPGVTVKEGCIIAAGAVVTTDCDANGLYGGVPARRIKDLDIICENKKVI